MHFCFLFMLLFFCVQPVLLLFVGLGPGIGVENFLEVREELRALVFHSDLASGQHFQQTELS